MSLRQRSYLLLEAEAELNGRPGKWRRVANHNVFFPDDGGDPIGLPKTKSKDQKKKEMKKAAKKVAFFNRLNRFLKRNKKAAQG